MNLLLVRSEEVAPDGSVTLSDRRAEHILKVLKAQTGQSLRVGLLNGSLGHGRVVEAADGQVSLSCVFDSPPPARLDLCLLLALPRPKVLKRLWAPLASLGVSRIILCNAAKVERQYFATHWIEPRHYEPLLIEGLEQAGDTQLPQVSLVRRLKPFLEDELDDLHPNNLRLLAHPADDHISPNPIRGNDSVFLAVGPEGGWTEFELHLFGEHGFFHFSLGQRTLRTDVACVSLISFLQNLSFISMVGQ